MSRVDRARESFLKGDAASLKKTHSLPNIEKDFEHEEVHKKGFTLPEIILGGQDGLVNVLGVILGLAAATSSNELVIVAGLSATFAESISMAAVAYTSRIAEADYHQSEYEREKWEIEHAPEGERQEVRLLYQKYGFKGKILDDIVETITSDKEKWVEVMMEQELKLEPINRKDAIPYGIIVGFSAIVGSFIPLTPFFFLPIRTAMIVAIVASALTLFVVGFYKAKRTLGRSFLRQGLEMTVIGMVSAFVGYFIGTLFQLKH